MIETNVVYNRKLSENGVFLRQISDAETAAHVDRQLAQIIIFQPNVPFFRFNQTQAHIERGRFSGAVSP